MQQIFYKHKNILLVFSCISLLFLYQPNQKIDLEVENLALEYDLKLVTSALAKGYCDQSRSISEDSITTCMENFQLASDLYYSSHHNLKILLHFEIQDAIYYIDQLAAGVFEAQTEEEKTFLRQYNPWLLQVANLHLLQNHLSPLNFNLTSILKSMVLSNSFMNYAWQITIFFLVFYYLQRFYPLKIISASFFLIFTASIILGCLYFTRPSNYILGSSLISVTSIAILLGASWRHKITKLHSYLLKSPFHLIPLAIPLLIVLVYCIAITYMTKTPFQSTPVLLSTLLAFMGGIILEWNFESHWKNNAVTLSTLHPETWEKTLHIHLDQMELYKTFAEKCFEIHVQGVMTTHLQNLAQKFLPRYFKLLELKDHKIEFLKELTKYSDLCDLDTLCSEVSPHWLKVLWQNTPIQNESLVSQNLLHFISKHTQSLPDTTPVVIRASRLRRLLAFIFDLIFYSINLSLVQSYIDPLFISIPPIRNVDFVYYAEILSKIVTITIVVIPPLLLWQATLGKKILSIKIAHANNGATLSSWQLLGREFIGKPISSFLLFMGYLMILLPGRKTLHDHLFATQVIINYND